LALQMLDFSRDPTQYNIKAWMEGISKKIKPIEQTRWQQAYIDENYYCGNQSYINQQFNFAPQYNAQKFAFNLVQQPVNMVNGYLMDHQKSPRYTPAYGSDPQTTDQYTKLIVPLYEKEGIQQNYLKACEFSSRQAMCLMQPYFDFFGDDPAQGSLKLKVWDAFSYMADPFFREPDGSDATMFWTQEFIDRDEAKERFGEKVEGLRTYTYGGADGTNFYFLPENFSLFREDMLIVSYIWFKARRNRKRLYSASHKQFFDMSPKAPVDQILYNIPDLREVTTSVRTWRCATVVNDRLMAVQGNPYTDRCPMIPVFWNYDPHMQDFNLRCRSLVFPMRSAQFLTNRRIILNHSISESTLASGYKRKVGAVVNEDNLKRTDGAYDILINADMEMTDVEKILPNPVPASDIQLAEIMADMIFKVAGVNLENWSGQDDAGASSLSILMKQGANLMVLQKFFAQWDFAFKLLADLNLEMVLNAWNPTKIQLLLGEELSPFLYSQVFSKWQTVSEEGLHTATQKQQEYRQTLELNAALGGIIPPSYIASIATIQGKTKLMQVLQQQEQQQAAVAEHQQQVAGALEEAKLKELYSKAVANVATARERNGRAESNIGLFEERLSMIGRNNSMSTKAKAEALEKLVEVTSKYGELEAHLKMNELQSLDNQEEDKEELAKADAKRTSMANDFVAQMLASMGQGQQAQGQ
jgi:hypothetical protein